MKKLIPLVFVAIFIFLRLWSGSPWSFDNLTRNISDTFVQESLEPSESFEYQEYIEGIEGDTELDESENPAEEAEEPVLLPEHQFGHPDHIDEIIAQMTLREKVGQLFVVRMPDMLRAQSLIEDYHIGGFVLFSSDVSSIYQVQQLISDLQENSAIPLFIAVDEEGGRVSRIGRLFEERIPSPYAIGSTGDPQQAYDAYYLIGQRLALLGFNMNFAPVADIWTNPSNTVIGDRAFGTEPDVVADMVEAAIQGLQSAGILSVIKHFPGHGDTLEDSHYNMAFFHHDKERFEQIESLPFRRGIEAGADGIMLGHIAALDLIPEEHHIATFSRYIIEEVLRQSWGFNRLVITDALDMRGLTHYFSHEDIIIASFLAGSDILLMPQNPEEAINTLINAYETGSIDPALFHSRLNESLRRILSVKF